MVQDASYWINRPENDEQKDWTYGEDTWIDGYWTSRDHEHRRLIISALNSLKFDSILEVGCNVGANLHCIRSIAPWIEMAGIDVNSKLITEAKKHIPCAKLKVGNLLDIPFKDKSYDVVLSDAVLLYIDPEHILDAMNELDRIARKAIVLVERFDRSLSGNVKGHVWARNYKKLLEGMGYSVVSTKITKKDWPSSLSWQKYGRLYVATRE